MRELLYFTLFGIVFLCSSYAFGISEMVFYVSTKGNDAWSGKFSEPNPDSTDGPFATLKRARDAIREFKSSQAYPEKGFVVVIRGGDYFMQESLELNEQDSGQRGAPVVYRAFSGEKVRLLGGKVIQGFKPLAEQAVMERIDPSVRNYIVELNLHELGIDDFGTLKRRGFGIPAQPAAMELFFDGSPMIRARWPNEGWAKIAGVLEGDPGGFYYEGDRPIRWKDTQDIWVHGYWTWDWADSKERVQSIDPQRKIIRTVPPHGVYGYKQGARFYAENILEELDMPGEYYIDFSSGILYFYPPSPLENKEALVSIIDGPIVVMNGASHVMFCGLTFECTRGAAFSMKGGSWNSIKGCNFFNIGSRAIYIEDGLYNGVESCNFRNLGDGGVFVEGGNRKTLKPGANYVVNCDFDNFSYSSRTYYPAIHLVGVRNRAAHNHIRNAPHMAIGLYGNEHIVEFNKIHHVCMETHDAGALYFGRDWTCRQNVIRFNFFYELGRGDVQAIYLDDWSSGTLIYGNVCYRAGRGILIGGGRDNLVENNIFVDCTPAIHIDQRGLGWAKYYFVGNTNTLFERLYHVNAYEPPYALRYPELLSLISDEPAKAKNNHILRNVCVGGRWLDLLDNLTPEQIDIADNWTEGDPLFVNAENLNFQLQDCSPVYALGFQRIPFEQIGLYEDDLRWELENQKADHLNEMY